MRFASRSFALALALLLALVVALGACGTTMPDPPKREDPPRPETCALVCKPAYDDCPISPTDPSSDCRELCYYGGCCELIDGEWRQRYVDCVPPHAAGDDTL